jgi:sporulation protein YlmC with PRC-barrel domain
MRNLLLTTALALPLSLGAAFAQDTATDPATTTPGTEPVPMATETDTDATTTDTTTDMTTTEPATDTMATDPATDPAMTTTAEPMADPATDPAAADMQAGETDQAEAAAAASASEKVMQEQATNELRIDWITGTNVQSPDGENIGSISDVIVDGDTGELKAAIVGVGGFLGIGQKQIALPWEQLQINYDAREIMSDLTREEADAAPEYVFRDREDAPAADGTMATDPAAAPMGTTDPAAAPMGTTDPAMNTTAPTADPAMEPADPAMTTDPAMEPTDDAAAAPATETVPMATEGEAVTDEPMGTETETPPASN